MYLSKDEKLRAYAGGIAAPELEHMGHPAMRIGIISDAHGNAPALSRCLDVLRRLGAERVLYLGDAVGYFPHAAAVCRLLLRADALCLMGNTEAMLLGRLALLPEKEAVLRLGAYCRHIPRAWLRQVEKTGPSARLCLDGMRLLLAHASPDDPLEGSDFLLEAPMPHTDIILTGHTHRARLRHSFASDGASVTVHANVGSCGYPRDHGTLLSLALLDSAAPFPGLTLWRVPFAFSPSVLGMVHEKVSDYTRRYTPDYTGSIWEEA